MLTSKEQAKNYQNLRAFFEQQRKVRDGEVEGMVDPSFHKDAVTLYAYGIISMKQADQLQEILK